MDSTTFVQKVKMLCLLRDVKPTNACVESGVGSSFLPDIKRGRIPSVEKVQMLAAYLGVTTSELLGEEKKPTPVSEDGLSEEQLELIDLFESAPPALRAAALAVLRSAEGQDKPQDGASADE